MNTTTARAQVFALVSAAFCAAAFAAVPAPKAEANVVKLDTVTVVASRSALLAEQPVIALDTVTVTASKAEVAAARATTQLAAAAERNS
ncbi:hypothetical protein [Piscinibacterium candidicorallinum]|jgi:hypothetical protein|uniref:DUF541 domain-containing protein n=1 Tax=Piscinibacterium candidicorallinum TaxID=1793872 RepID=A0ABV7H9W5_9BURK